MYEDYALYPVHSLHCQMDRDHYHNDCVDHKPKLCHTNITLIVGLQFRRKQSDMNAYILLF